MRIRWPRRSASCARKPDTGQAPSALWRRSNSTPGFCEEVMYFYLAEGLQPGAQALDEDERIEVATVSLADAWNLVASGEIADCKTVLALLWLESGRGEVGGGFDAVVVVPAKSRCKQRGNGLGGSRGNT